MYRVLKENGHRRPAVWLLNAPGSAAAFGEVADGIADDCYPLPHRPMISVAKYMDHTHKMLEYNKPVWFIVQGLDWRLGGPPYYPIPKGRKKVDVLEELRAEDFVFCPNPREIRAMAYLSLVHGALGVMIYPGSGGPRHVTIRDFPEDWRAVCAIAAELRHLSPMLLAPDRPVGIVCEPEGTGLHMMTRRFEGKTYVIAINPGKLPIAPVFSFPGKREARIEVLFENRTIQTVGGTFRDMFQAGEARVYRID